MDQTPVQTDPTPAPTLHILSFEEIMAAPDLATVVVQVPEWGGAVEIRPLTVGERSQCLADAQVGDGADGTRFDNTLYTQSLLHCSLVAPALSVAQASALMAQKSDRAAHRITEEIADINGWSERVKAATLAAFRPQPAAVREV